MKTLDRIFNYLLFITSLILGTVIIVYCINRAVLAYQSPNWKYAPGLIASSHISTGVRNSISVNVVYHYTVNDVTYVGTVVGYGFRGFPDNWKREEAESKVAQYSRGASVQVYYKPSSPENSCLEPGGNLLGYSLPVTFGIFFCVFGVWGIQQRLKKPPNTVKSVND
jgi:hypothetical protein